MTTQARTWGEPLLVLLLYVLALAGLAEGQSCTMDPRTGRPSCATERSSETRIARTTNFVVEASDARLAEELAATAEQARRELAEWFFGQTLPNWPEPCRITARLRAGTSGGGGTSFIVTAQGVRDWRMNIVGTREQMIRSVVPHEVAHCVLASYFGRPLPRWLDEGLAASVEDQSQIARYERTLVHILQHGRGIALDRLLAARDYPADHEAFYAQSHSLVTWLVERRGRRALVEYATAAQRGGDWAGLLCRHYEAANLTALQEQWLAWVRSGRPRGEHASAPPRPARVDETIEPRVPRDAIGRVRVGNSLGTGSLVAPRLVLTCWHLFRDAPHAEPVVELPEGSFRARLVASDEVNDLAVVELERAAEATPLTTGDWDPTARELFAAGYGSGTWSVFRGRPAGWVTHRDQTSRALVVAGMATRPGDSGAPLLDARMHLVGVVWGNDGRAYGCVGQPLRMLLDRVLPGRPGVVIPRADWQVVSPPPQPTAPSEPAAKESAPAPTRPAPSAPPRARGPTSSPPIEHELDWPIVTWMARRVWMLSGLTAGGAAAGVGLWLARCWWWRRRGARRNPKNDGRFVDIPRADDDALARAERGAMTRLRQTQPSAVPTVRQFQRFRDTRFVPFEVDSFARADQEAMRAFVDRYPGATYVLEAFQGMRDQFLKGQIR